MNVADRHVDDVHWPQAVNAAIKRRLSPAAVDQQNLMQPRMTVNGKHPVMQNRT